MRPLDRDGAQPAKGPRCLFHLLGSGLESALKSREKLTRKAVDGIAICLFVLELVSIVKRDRLRAERQRAHLIRDDNHKYSALCQVADDMCRTARLCASAMQSRSQIASLPCDLTRMELARFEPQP